MDNLDFVDQVEDVHIDVNDEHPTPVQSDTRTVKGMFDTFMQNFDQMSKITRCAGNLKDFTLQCLIYVFIIGYMHCLYTRKKGFGTSE